MKLFNTDAEKVRHDDCRPNQPMELEEIWSLHAVWVVDSGPQEGEQCVVLLMVLTTRILPVVTYPQRPAPRQTFALCCLSVATAYCSFLSYQTVLGAVRFNWTYAADLIVFAMKVVFSYSCCQTGQKRNTRLLSEHLLRQTSSSALGYPQFPHPPGMRVHIAITAF